MKEKDRGERMLTAVFFVDMANSKKIAGWI